MKGLLVTFRNKSSSYQGFDFYETWLKLDVWNQKYPKLKVELCEESYFYGLNMDPLFKYFFYLRETEKDKTISLISMNKKIDNFCFIGYDCGFIREEGEILLFSTIYNELFNPVNISVFKRFVDKLNQFSLFSDINDAMDYIKFREFEKKKSKFNCEFRNGL